jgi:hypothetical protein
MKEMKYLVKAKLKQSKKTQLLNEIKRGTLGTGSVAFGEYVKNMHQARVLDDGYLSWIEVCFCPTPLQEEKSYWAEYFEEITTKDVVSTTHCKDSNGSAKRACFDCSCSKKLEKQMSSWGKPFFDNL